MLSASPISPLEDLIANYQQEFLLKRNQLIALVQHYPSIGEHREELLRAFLETHLPQRYAVGTGFIYSPDRNSRQCDILVYDHVKYPIPFREGRLVVVDPAAVVAVIEVKSKLTKSTLAEAHDIIGAAKRANPQCAGYVFSYGCCGNRALRSFVEHHVNNGTANTLPDGIYGLPSLVIRRYEANINCYSLNGENECLGHFYTDLVSTLPETNPNGIPAMRRQRITIERLAFTVAY